MKGTNDSGNLIQVLRHRPILEGRERRRCRLRGTFQLSQLNGLAHGSAKLSLVAISRRRLEAMKGLMKGLMKGRWSVFGECDGCGDLNDMNIRQGQLIRRGPHPSLYPPTRLTQLGYCDGRDVMHGTLALALHPDAG